MWLYVTVAIIGAIAIILPYGVYLLFPQRREAISRTAWFAFAPLVVGICGFIGLVIYVLSAGNDLSPNASTGLAGSGAIVAFNLFNGYRSVSAWWQQRKH